MITIPIKVCGDIWCNSDEISVILSSLDPTQDVYLDVRAEGPSLSALGILDMLQQHCDSTGRNPQTMRLVNAPNQVEHTVFQNTGRGISHFFPMSVRYWEPVRPICEAANRLAMFVGRGTVARCVMMYELCHDPMSRHFRFSTMDYDGQPIWKPYEGWKVLEKFTDWLPQSQINDLYRWWQTDRPRSLDGKKVRDQYAADQNTNRSLLGQYAFFRIELVAETYTLGETFFPTEKTVRPIMAAKPWLIYGAQNFVKRLRDMGFVSYQDLWDESYDQYQGPERWHHMRGVIQDLCQMPELAFQQLMDEAQHIALLNRRILADIVLTEKSHAIHAAGIA